ncbi:DUF4407 domain-containing protein [Nocardia sp. NBC_00565]|uniref:DUF4407 domain-containing protein n=1 Tax=Nocardia sp. NBC_00565 TaxID=2975993 RepID=UPI002E802948|nr:DUF4407 domain-containing protein [Nocardia sp. NBC_00565]WUC01981.1 DUF4407 domain-containing protein [Nocardia sp. NBC_00565]
MTVTGLFIWLGGGLGREQSGTELDYPHERSGYAVTGAVVVLFATVAGVVTTLALAAAGNWPLFAIVLVALVIALLTGAVGRALATARPGSGPDRRGLAGRITVAVLAGVLIAELAATVLFGGTVDRLLDEKAQRAVDSAPAVVAARTELDRAEADRAALDQSIVKAQADIDRALVIARCEYNPSPECPQTRITGVPGRGPESQTDNAMLDDARKQLAAAQDRVAGLDQRVTADQQALTAADSVAFADADRGLGARWLAMNDYTTDKAGAFPLRVLTIITFVLLALLPLILRWWRGETSFDRRLAFHTVQDRAERSADAAIAVKRAEVRAEAETLRAEHQLTAAQLAVEADTAIDRERQRTRIIAAIGGLQIGITEPPHGELPAGSAGDREDSSVSQEGYVTPNLPATVSAGALAPTSGAGAVVPQVAAQVPTAPQTGGGLELPIIGTVPFTDTAARWIRPLVPSFVANAIDTATHPLRTARQAFEEVEEITFTLRRTRKVTIDTQDSHAPAMSQAAGYQLQPGSAEAWHAQRVAANVVDADYQQPAHYSALPQTTVQQGYGLPPADRHDELSAQHRGELQNRPGPRELPPAN